MSLRLEMLQVARLAPTQLGESSSLVAAFFHNRWNPSGGFQNRTGESDLYYTVFGIEGLIALQTDLPSGPLRTYLERFGDGEGLDFVHLACLARCWAGVQRSLEDVPAAAILQRIERFRSADGGYAQTTGAVQGSVYACFLALGAYQDMQAPLPEAGRILECLSALRARDGGYSNLPNQPFGLTTTTAAAVMLLRHLEVTPEPQLGMWLLDRCHGEGGFFAMPAAPVPDLLSTATALHALAALQIPLIGIQEPCLDFLDTLWSKQGGFYGNWADDTLDCEYTYYALLALGHLSVTQPKQ